MARKQITKSLRFDVFKRDSFKCVYCGSTPPNVILEVDHILPVSKGGQNNADNLVTACLECNRGKSDGLLTAVPISLKDKAIRVKESEEQIKEYYKILESAKQRIESETWAVCEILQPDCSNGIPRRVYQSVKMFLSKLPYYEVLDAMEIAVNTKSRCTQYYIFKYFCGICWNKIKNLQYGS